MIDEFSSFEDLGFGGNPSPDYKKIIVHMVYAVKHDRRHKARLIAGGHLTETPINFVYSSVVSLHGIRLLTFVAELNNLEVWATNIGNACLESCSQEKAHIIAGPEFGNQQGHTLVICKALHGLKAPGFAGTSVCLTFSGTSISFLPKLNMTFRCTTAALIASTWLSMLTIY